jgi:hypothetical protein
MLQATLQHVTDDLKAGVGMLGKAAASARFNRHGTDVIQEQEGIGVGMALAGEGAMHDDALASVVSVAGTTIRTARGALVSPPAFVVGLVSCTVRSR